MSAETITTSRSKWSPRRARARSTASNAPSMPWHLRAPTVVAKSSGTVWKRVARSTVVRTVPRRVACLVSPIAPSPLSLSERTATWRPDCGAGATGLRSRGTRLRDHHRRPRGQTGLTRSVCHSGPPLNMGACDRTKAGKENFVALKASSGHCATHRIRLRHSLVNWRRAQLGAEFASHWTMRQVGSSSGLHG
jgi:hypothetical protein